MSTTATTTTVIDPATVRARRVVGDEVTPLVSGVRTGGAYEVFSVEGPADSGPPPHHHPWQESYVVLEGELEVLDGDTWARAKAGDAVHIPAGTLHAYRIASERARFLVVTPGDRAGRFFEDVDANVGPLPESLPTLIEVARRNGLRSPLFES